MEIIDVGLEFNSNISKMGNINGIVLHHTGVTVEQSVEVIHNYHKNHNGWAGIGYQYYVRKDGSIYKGRPEEYAGAHCPGVNSSSIGICAEGNFDVEEMSEIQKNSIIELITYIKQEHNIEYIKGHREILSTSCPGANYPLDEIRNAEISPVEPDYPLLKLGSKGNYVELLQNKLIEKGYNLQRYGADSNFGNETEKAVKELQDDAGISVDGIVGNDTWSIILSDFVKPTKQEYPGYLIYKGQKSEDVRTIQNRLIELGYNCGRYGADSIFGDSTEKAVKDFQRNNGLAVDGIVGILTWNELF